VREVNSAIVRSGSAGNVGALLGVEQHKQVRAETMIESSRHPASAVLLSEAQRHRNCTVCPDAAAGRFMTVETNPPDVPLQAKRPANGLL